MPLATSYSHLQDVKSCDSTKRQFAVRDKKKKEKKNYNHSFIYFLFIYLSLASREPTPVSFGKQTNKQKKNDRIQPSQPPVEYWWVLSSAFLNKSKTEKSSRAPVRGAAASGGWESWGVLQGGWPIPSSQNTLPPSKKNTLTKCRGQDGRVGNVYPSLSILPTHLIPPSPPENTTSSHPSRKRKRLDQPQPCDLRERENTQKRAEMFQENEKKNKTTKKKYKPITVFCSISSSAPASSSCSFPSTSSETSKLESSVAPDTASFFRLAELYTLWNPAWMIQKRKKTKRKKQMSK